VLLDALTRLLLLPHSPLQQPCFSFETGGRGE
jgi:hypothetical protein